MAASIFYEPGTVRWRRHTGSYDVRAHRAPGWEVEAVLLDYNPVTGKPLRQPQWWFREEKERG